MSYQYAEVFKGDIEQQYKREATSSGLARNQKFKFIDAQTVKVANITLSGYKNHNRDGSVNTGTIENKWLPFALGHDRDISFYVDEMDEDETSRTLGAANITATFQTEQAIPETDAYRYSKLFAEVVKNEGTIVDEILTAENVLQIFDDLMEQMDEAEVPGEGRILYATPRVVKLLKTAEDIQRAIIVNSPNAINRTVASLDDVEIVKVPSSRMLSKYDFSNGFAAHNDAIQQHMILVHPSAVIAPVKVSDVYLWPKGTTPESAFGWLYKNRSYQDLFVIPPKSAGVAICAYPTDAIAAGVLSVTLGKGASGGTKTTAISPAKTSAQSVLYKINGSIPYKGKEVEDGVDGWHAYTAGNDIAAAAGDVIVFAVVTTASNEVVNAGKVIVAAADLA